MLIMLRSDNCWMYTTSKHAHGSTRSSEFFELNYDIDLIRHRQPLFMATRIIHIDETLNSVSGAISEAETILRPYTSFITAHL